jgi:hypothetical protein
MLRIDRRPGYKRRALIVKELRAVLGPALAAAIDEVLTAERLAIAPQRAKPGPKSQRDAVLAWIGDRPITPTLKRSARKEFKISRPTLDRWLRNATGKKALKSNLTYGGGHPPAS